MSDGERMTPRIALLGAWIALVILSVTTVLAGRFDGAVLPAAIVVLAGLAKAWIIVDRFMELRHAPRFWRFLVLGWPLMMALAIAAGLVGRTGT